MRIQSNAPAVQGANADLVQGTSPRSAEMAQARAEVARAMAEARRAAIEAEIAQAEAGRARLASGTTLAPHGPTPRQEKMMFSGFVILTIAAVIILQPIMRALGRRLERSKRSVDAELDSGAQLQRIEHAVEAMAVEIERISEGQRFAIKLQQANQHPVIGHADQ